MALVASNEGSLDTDFAILAVCETGADSTDDGPMNFATSLPGRVELVCGTKYAEVAVRIEVHDREPPEPTTYEDCDEVPWRSVGDGRVEAVGFADETPVAALDVSGIGPSRVRVCASGRYRYAYGDLVDGLPREKWLLQFWPDLDPTPEVDRRPRRLGGPPPFAPVRSTPWLAAMHAWNREGWASLVGGMHQVHMVRMPLFREKRPLTAEELSAGGDPSAMIAPDRGELATPLGSVTTWASLIDAMHQVGLLAVVPTSRGPAYLPNPGPAPAWTVVEMDPSRAENLKRRAHFDEYRSVQPDIEHLCRWTQGSMIATPRRIAVRLALPVDDIVETLHVMDYENPGRVQGDPTNVDTPVTVSPRPDRRARLPWAAE